MENDDLYNICESVTVTAASVILPVAATGTATIKGFARSAFEYGVSGLAGQGSSYLAYKATGDKNIANIANIIGSTVAGESLAGKSLPRRIKNVENKFNTNSVEKSGKSVSNKVICNEELVVRDKKFLDKDGNVDWEKWAPNGGRVLDTVEKNQTISIGTVIDRYGSQWGKYTSPLGVPYENRSLPYIENPYAYHKYQVLKKIDNVTVSEIAPAFGQVGGGIQYELPYNIKKLKNLGYIKEID